MTGIRSKPATGHHYLVVYGYVPSGGARWQRLVCFKLHQNATSVWLCRVSGVFRPTPTDTHGQTLATFALIDLLGLQARVRQHPLSKALLEHGKLIRTVHNLRWFSDEAFRRRVGRQLNRGEGSHDLRHFIAFAHGEKMRHRHHEDQTTRARCLSLVADACTLSNTNAYSATTTVPDPSNSTDTSNQSANPAPTGASYTPEPGTNNDGRSPPGNQSHISVPWFVP